ILLFQETAGEDLLARIEGDLRSPESLPRRVSLEAGGQTFLVSLLGRPGSDDGVWGLLVDALYLRDALLLPALERQIDTAATQWIVRGRDGNTVIAGTDSPSGPLALNATIAGNFPPWLIEFYQRPQSTFQLLLASGQSIYLYMVLAIATILGFGLILTTRAVTHELELARLKSDFVSTVSHEFKSPLTSIRQLAEMLQTGRVPSEERRQRYYDILVEQSSRLSSLVTNVLDLARIEEGRREFRFEPVDLGAVVRELVETTQHRVGHEGFEVRAHVQEPLPPIRGDGEALRQALSNLLNNAIQYSGEARRINVTASAEGGVVTVAVEDSGLGIPDEEVGKVFDRFHRGSDELTRSTRGSGLGLTLVKETVDAHGGSVEVRSQVGKGSTFCIKLPAMTEPNHG
ncbi:MAG: HAMP domain-containing histidine kinase, partial [Longimicrobiales bacterium]|nr:HAMP domain-containing histidine kinase [Longimicrobiales bacterium]